MMQALTRLRERGPLFAVMTSGLRRGFVCFSIGLLGLSLQISSAPPAISTASTVSLEFNADKAGANFFCLLTISGEILIMQRCAKSIRAQSACSCNASTAH